MTAKELRIGNFVYYKHKYGVEIGEISHLTDIGFFSVRIGDMEYDGKAYNSIYHCIKPIPITEDILLNCGFKKQNDGEYITIYTKSDCIDILCQKNVYYPYNYHYGIFLGKELKSIHELQNVVFALTGQELEIEI